MRMFGRDDRDKAGSNAGSGVADVLELAADRIDAVVDAANVAATDITAESRARLGSGKIADDQISRERLVAELADSLVTRAEALSREASDLSDVLARASTRLAARPGPQQVPEPDPEPAPDPHGESDNRDLGRRVSERFQSSEAGRSVAFKPRPGTAKPERSKSRQSNDGLRLLATQMAVAGSTPEQIQDRLRSEFGVEDASSLLDEVMTALPPGRRRG